MISSPTHRGLCGTSLTWDTRHSALLPTSQNSCFTRTGALQGHQVLRSKPPFFPEWAMRTSYRHHRVPRMQADFGKASPKLCYLPSLLTKGPGPAHWHLLEHPTLLSVNSSSKNISWVPKQCAQQPTTHKGVSSSSQALPKAPTVYMAPGPVTRGLWARSMWHLLNNMNLRSHWELVNCYLHFTKIPGHVSLRGTRPTPLSKSQII